MSPYKLDTDTCAFIPRRSPPRLLARIQAVPFQKQTASAITLAELLYGAQGVRAGKRRTGPRWTS